MSRLIKFRVWNDVVNKMETPSSFHYSDEKGFSGTCPTGSFVKRNDEVTQYTGLKDAAGADIYEGDIVEYRGMILMVYFDQGSFLIGEEPNEMNLWDAVNENVHRPRIIGNVFENPELLKAEKMQ